MELRSLDCASLLTYAPRGEGADRVRSRDVMLALKHGTLSGNPPTSISQQVARWISDRRDTAPLMSVFSPPPVLVPTPRSSLRREEDLWIPLQLANDLQNHGLGVRVAPVLSRTEAIPKSASSVPAQRARAQRHFETMAVQSQLGKVEAFLLVDDVVTRGATLLGAANRLWRSFPGVPIKAFAAMRTVSDPEDFRQVIDPCLERIRLQADGSTLRRPV
jgi:hypothetical protein